MFNVLPISAANPLTSVRAWAYLGVNLFATPGLGSWWGGRKAAGVGQLCFSVSGFFLMVAWMFKVIFGNMAAQMEGMDAAPVPAWWWQSGVAAFGVSWLWSLVTSISMVIEAARNPGRSVVAPPPILPAVSKSAPPPPLTPVYKLKPLDAFQISAALATVPAWQRQGVNIVRQFQFADFAAAMLFVNRVAQLAEEAGHHPDIDIRWNRVTLALSTHDVDGLTDRDFALARQFDRL